MAKRTTSSCPLPSSLSSMRTEAAGQWENDEIAKTLSRRNNTVYNNHDDDDDSFMEATMQQYNGNGKMMLHDHDMLRYLINSDNKTNNLKVMDYSHLVPDHDEDHDHYVLQYQHQNYYYYSTLLLDDATAPTATEFDHMQQMKSNFLDDADDAAMKMINSKISNSFSAKRIIPQPFTDHETIPITVPAAAADDDDDDKHSVVPHHHQYDPPLHSHHCSCSQLPASKHPMSSDPKSKLADPNSAINNEDTNKAEAEAIVPSLSVCSNDLPYPTGNVQNQSIEHEEHDQQALTRKKSGTWRTTPAKTKYARTRATRLQNFSQRKRRDNKIKKKMRQLQQLIPNCDNKVDKAAILDEAIVYLKALQLQLQIMSMGTGVVPPMMIGNGALAPHLNYMPTTSALSPFQMLGFHPHAASFVPLMTPSLILPHPSISLSTSMNSNPSHQPH